MIVPSTLREDPVFQRVRNRNIFERLKVERNVLKDFLGVGMGTSQGFRVSH